MSSDLCIVLEVNNAVSAEIFRSEPIVFTLKLSNPSALEDENQNEIIDMQIAEVEKRYEKEEISKEGYEEEIERLKDQKIEIKPVTLGSESKPWTDAIKFRVLEDDKWKPLAWGLELLYSLPKENRVEFKGNVVAYAEYGLESEKVEGIPEGTYQIRAATSKAKSNPVVLRLVKKAEKKQSEEKLRRIAEYYIRKERYEDAFKISNRILKRNPHSIPALILMSDYYASKKEYDKALKVLEKAKEEYGTRHPDWYEPPNYIQKKIIRIERMRRQQEEA